MASQTPDDPRRILRPREVARLIGLSRQTLWRLARAGEFPKPIRLSTRSIGWPAHVVDEWIAARRAA